MIQKDYLVILKLEFSTLLRISIFFIIEEIQHKNCNKTKSKTRKKIKSKINSSRISHLNKSKTNKFHKDLKFPLKRKTYRVTSKNNRNTPDISSDIINKNEIVVSHEVDINDLNSSTEKRYSFNSKNKYFGKGFDTTRESKSKNIS